MELLLHFLYIYLFVGLLFVMFIHPFIYLRIYWLFSLSLRAQPCRGHHLFSLRSTLLNAARR